MTDRADGQWRWPLPDDWEPEGTWCVTITIPADQQYFDRLTGALGMLTLSKAWFPDPTGQGPKAVAAAWEAALYLTPFQLNETCIVTPSPPIPDQAAADDAAAAVFTVFYQYIAGQIIGCAHTLGDCGNCVDDLMTTLGPYGASDAVRGALQRLCTDMVNDPAAAGEFATDCPYPDQYDDLRQKINDNPYDWLNKLSDWIFDWLNTTASNIFNDLNTVAGLLGGGGIGNFINDHGGIPSGGGAGFGSTCPWIVELDLTTDIWYGEPDPSEVTFGWTANFGAWTSGVGWQATDADRTPSPGERARLAHVLFTFPWSFTITQLTVVYDLTKGSYDPADIQWQHQAIAFGGSVFTGDWNGDDSDGTGKEITLTATVTSDTAALYLVAHHVHDGSALGGSLTVTKLIIHGTGTNPFI
jgi:hypothetical protein